MGGKVGVKEKFSFCRFRLKKVKKVGKLRMDGYAAGLPEYFPQGRESCKSAHLGREERDATHSAPRG